MTPAIANAPLMNTSHDGVVLASKEKRLECIHFKKRMEDVHKELEKSSIYIDHTLNNDLTSIISVNSSKLTPFMNLFWQQQKKLFKCSNKRVRFHPMLIRFCLSL